MYDVTPVTTEHLTACGPASLAMLLAYYGQSVPLDDLIDECDTRMIGCTGADLLRVGRLHGLDMLAYEMSADELLRQDRPAIIWWKYGHWCAFCGRNAKGEPVICNPCRGRYPLDAGTFGALYSGVALFSGVPTELPPDYFGEQAEEPDYFDN